MSVALEAVRNQLDAIGFRVRVGGWTPFDEELPLVTAVAWDESTAQLVLVAEETEESSDEDWRQLLFAAGAIRHGLSESGPARFGAPVVLAIVSEDGQQQLRQLAEDLIRDYVLFARVDLNLLPPQAIEDQDLLELALAPLLPRCRKALGQEISKGEIDRFWDRLAAEIRKAADGLPEMLGETRTAAAERAIEVLIGDTRGGPQLPPPQPVSTLRVQNFRSFRSAEVDFAGATVICGANGSGKTSLMEALELHWAKTSQRKPSDESAAAYARHLATDGLGEFSVTADGETTSSVADAPQTELARNVLPYDALRDVVTSKPDDRYSSLLATTGLEVPDVKARTARLVELTRRDADKAFSLLGLDPLPRANKNAYDYLLHGLRTPTHAGLPAADEVVGAELALAQASENAYQPRTWMSDANALRALEAADLEVGRVIGGEHSSHLAATLDAAVEALHKLMDERRDALRPLRALLAAIEMPDQATQAQPPPSGEQYELEVASELPASFAARWLAHANTLNQAALEFAEQAEMVENAKWRARVQAYADALRAAAEQAPRKQLQEWAAPAPPPPSVRSPTSLLDPQLSVAAGFTRPVAERSLVAPLRQLVEAIEDYGRGLRMVADQLAAHPARVFADNRNQVLEAVSAFELARKLRLAGPIMAASQQLVGELLRDRLFPVVRELAAAMVRFEWYFKPLKIPDTGRRVVLSGLSTSSDDLDARMVLNAAEATALGIAWFLALHMLQPAERRAVLVLDDPGSVFDPANLGGFVSTLRTFVRLTRPQQLIVATHDDAVAAMLADEFTPCEGWPDAVSLLRCERDREDRSVVRVRYTNSEPAGLEGELQRLGLMTTV